MDCTPFCTPFSCCIDCITLSPVSFLYHPGFMSTFVVDDMPSLNTKFTINVVPVTAKSADRTLLDFDVFGESEQTGAMTSKSDDHSLAWRNKNQIVSSLHLNPGVRCRRQHQLLKTQVEFLTGLWLRTWLVNVFVTCWETSAQHDGLRNQLESKKCTVRTLKVRVRTARTVRTS